MHSITIPCICVRKCFLLYAEFVGLSSYGQYQVLKKRHRVSEHLYIEVHSAVIMKNAD